MTECFCIAFDYVPRYTPKAFHNKPMAEIKVVQMNAWGMPKHISR